MAPKKKWRFVGSGPSLRRRRPDIAILKKAKAEYAELQ
jgi:hypothetical protein